MKHLSFELTMPNVGSWNGKWTGASKKYYILKTVTDNHFKNKVSHLLDGKKSNSWYYNFGHGWGASVRMELIDSKEKKLRNSMTNGFAGYDWMVESILEKGEILSH